MQLLEECARVLANPSLNAELSQLPLHARSAPARIGQTHSPDEVSDFTGYRWTAFPRAALPSPVESET